MPHPRADSQATVPGMLRRRAAQTPDAPARWSRDRQGLWQASDWRSFEQAAAELAQGLRQLGLAPGARVGLMAASSAAWDDCSMAVLAAGGVVVGIDAHASAEQVAACCAVVQLDALVADSAEQLARFGAARPGLCLLLGAAQTASIGCHTLQQVRAAGRAAGVHGWDASRPEDQAIVVFTSGTTGAPKGIAYRHAQVCLAVEAILGAFDDIRAGSRLACWLPLSNLFQRMINLCAIERNAQTFYVSDPREVMRHLPAIQPTVFIGVPRFFEKLYQGVLLQLRSGPAWRARLAAWALAVGAQAAVKRSAGQAPGWPLRARLWPADRLVLRRVRAALGGELRFLISGSAAMPPALLQAMQALGLPVLEAYGLSECIVPVALNRTSAQRQGTVGQPLQGVALRLADDGELLVRSAGVFDGYIGELAPPPALDAAGWLATGDLAEIDADGFVRLVGRKSELFKLSTGRRVAPAQIEALLSGVEGVEHVAVFGPGRKAPLLVVVMAPDTTADAVVGGLRRQAAGALAALPAYLRPVAAVLTRRPFSIDSGELTANLKMRRTAVGRRYATALDALQALADDAGTRPARGSSFQLGDEAVELVQL